MPSIKMKTKPSTGGLREKNGLHICQKSSMISKNPLSRTKVSQSTGVQTYNQSTQDALDYDKNHGEDVGKCDVDSDEWAYDEKLLPKLRLSVTDSAAPDNMEPTAATCTSGTETTLPPIMESMDAYRNEGSENPPMSQLDNEDSNGSCRSSCEYQECSVADFCISDILFSGPPIGSNTVFDNRTDSMFLSDSKCEQSSLLCDFSEEFMVLPFLEDSLDTGHGHDHKSSEETITNAENSSFYTAINQLRSSNQESHINTYPEPDYEYFDPQIYIRNIPDQQETAFNSLPTLVPNGKWNSKRITLVLDLDETLVHSTLDHCLDADFIFPVFFNMREQSVYVKRRPHLQTFLERVAEMFEIVVFTASQSFYAKQLLDILDPEGKIISGRAYRESCIFSEGSYVKDLTVLGVDLAKVAIIDNSPQVFSLQVNNGIPIKSWFDDPSDCALISLLPFLETLADADDVRPIIARKFGNKE